MPAPLAIRAQAVGLLDIPASQNEAEELDALAAALPGGRTDAKKAVGL